jgi:hypothetical protein
MVYLPEALPPSGGKGLILQSTLEEITVRRWMLDFR